MGLPLMVLLVLMAIALERLLGLLPPLLTHILQWPVGLGWGLGIVALAWLLGGD